MILIVSTCSDPLSELEFVRPLEKIISDSNVVHYTAITADDIETADKIIITGTALKDFDYLEDDFGWLKTVNKPVLGICAGMQAIVKTFGGELSDETTIGVQTVTVLKESILASDDFNAYFLHSKTGAGDFDVLGTVDGNPAMIKHPSKEIYGVIFHPEVMNEELIAAFTNA